MNLFEENLKVISQRNVPDFISEMEVGEAQFNYLGTEDEVKFFCDQNEKPFIIEPVIDKSHLPNPDLRQLIFFFGIASLKEINKVARLAHKDSLFVIIEPNPYFLQHALYYENFKILEKLNYIIVTEKSDKLTDLFKILFSTKFFYLIKNITFYLNSYYRKYDSGLVNNYISKIGAAIKNRLFIMGNSIQDSLIGLINNLNNIKSISENVDVARLKNVFSGVPAFVIAAGPSLDKNINELKAVQGKGIIIAVDTIAQKLLNNGITPDFICTVERGSIVWEYFYDKREYPSNTYLVSSLVADPRIVKMFKNRAVLPMRSNVREYYWLSEQLGLTQDHFIWMGASCAHIATGFAYHIGASPIVLVGQDLAYGENGTHAKDTIYDQKKLDLEEEDLLTPGYYGGSVRTSKIWKEFEQLFENMFTKINRLIINATEGGAKIEGTIQRELRNVVKEYCKEKCDVSAKMREIPNCIVDWNSVEDRIHKYLNNLERQRLNIANHMNVLIKINRDWVDPMPDEKVKKIYEIMKKTDVYYKSINKDQLLYHNIQGPLVILLQKFNTIVEDDSLKSLKENLEVQIELCEMMENTMWLIIQVIKENFPWNQTEHSL